MKIKKLILLPIWFLTLFIQPFLKPTHPWKYKKLTLQWWADGSTGFAVEFSLCIWFGFIINFIILLMLYRR